MVFARACGAALTTLNAKIALSSPDCWLSEDFNWLLATSRCLSNAITAIAGAETSNCFLSATIGCLLARLRGLGAPFGSAPGKLPLARLDLMVVWVLHFGVLPVNCPLPGWI